MWVYNMQEELLKGACVNVEREGQVWRSKIGPKHVTDPGNPKQRMCEISLTRKLFPMENTDGRYRRTANTASKTSKLPIRPHVSGGPGNNGLMNYHQK